MSEKKPSISRKLLKLRKRAKQKKPEFLRSESWRYSKMSQSWRRPRGLDHKMRRKIKGWPPMVSTGYKGPKVARGLHPSGLREVLIHNMNELSQVDSTVQAARIAHTVGKKKRALILAEAKTKKITILNPGIEEAVEEEPGETVEEREETPVEEEKAPAKELKKPKRMLLGRKKTAKEETKPAEEAVEVPKKTRKIAKTEEGAEER
jgi:large subunit ribosomal protein L32e